MFDGGRSQQGASHSAPLLQRSHRTGETLRKTSLENFCFGINGIQEIQLKYNILNPFITCICWYYTLFYKQRFSSTQRHCCLTLFPLRGRKTTPTQTF